MLSSPGRFAKTLNPSAPSLSRWGGGSYEDAFYGGIYMASTVGASCKLYQHQVRPGRMGAGGDCEHLRFVMELEPCESYSPSANTLVWLTDSTLHEALPLPDARHRQFFRLVTSGDQLDPPASRLILILASFPFAHAAQHRESDGGQAAARRHPSS